MSTENQKIVPQLWFDTQAAEAADFYVSIFPDSRIHHRVTLHHTPSGDTEAVYFELLGHEIGAISAGPMFRLNPSISFMVNFDPSRMEDAEEQLDLAWQKLSEGGQVLMELGSYDFSPKYGWVQDRFGLSWQLILTNPQGDERPELIPALMFVGDVNGKAEEAVRFYMTVFDRAGIGSIHHYPQGAVPGMDGLVMFADFLLENQWFAANDGGLMHEFAFNEALSLMVRCSTQEEIDYFWAKLSADPDAEACGWLKDKFGVSWQIVPAELERMMTEGSEEQVARVVQTFLPMKKLDAKALRRAYES